MSFENDSCNMREWKNKFNPSSPLEILQRLLCVIYTNIVVESGSHLESLTEKKQFWLSKYWRRSKQKYLIYDMNPMNVERVLVVDLMIDLRSLNSNTHPFPYKSTLYSLQRHWQVSDNLLTNYTLLHYITCPEIACTNPQG